VTILCFHFGPKSQLSFLVVDVVVGDCHRLQQLSVERTERYVSYGFVYFCLAEVRHSFREQRSTL
jgi:hypothetical protein